MKKILMPMMVVMVLTSAMSFTSCSSDVADAIGDAIARELIDEPTIRGTWSNYVEDTTPDYRLDATGTYKDSTCSWQSGSIKHVVAGSEASRTYYIYGAWLELS